MTHIGNYAYTCKLEKLARITEDEWINIMERRNCRVSDHPVTEENRTAWRDCYRVLRDCAEQLPAQFRKLDIVFEYVLPLCPPGHRGSERGLGVRADVLLVSAKTVMVLEFKQRNDVFIGHVRQTRKYRSRIQNFHKESLGMFKRAILVLTAGEGISEQYHKVSVRSRDLLTQEIIHLFEDSPAPHPDFKSWLNSNFEIRKGFKVR